MTTHPLTGKRIIITRPPHQAGALAAQLRALGAEPVIWPTITIRPVANPAPLNLALSQLEHYDWLIVTSANTVTHLWQCLDALGIDPATLKWPSIAVVGQATGSALAERGVQPAIMPDTHVAEALFDALQAHDDLAGTYVLLPQGNLARPMLADLLRGTGANVDVVVAYETVRPEFDPALLTEPVDAITFTSSSSVQNFVDMVDDPLAMMGGALVACIGPVTADTARELGLEVAVIAEPHTVEGLITALAQAFERKPIR